MMSVTAVQVDQVEPRYSNTSFTSKKLGSTTTSVRSRSSTEKKNQLNPSAMLKFSSQLSVPQSFMRDFVASSLILLAIILAALLDPQVDLKEKLMLQSSGLSHLLDTYSDALIVLIVAYQVKSKNEWCTAPKPLKMSYVGVILFGIVATYFHAAGIEESGEEPHQFFSCFFCIVGAFILYWQAKGLIDTCSSPSKDSITKTKARFLCLATLPPLLCQLGASSAINRFLFNGWAFFYSAIAFDPLLKEATKGTASSFSLKLKALRILFPVIGLAYVAESLIVELLKLDAHCIIHVLVVSHVLLIHSCLSSSGTGETSDLREL